VGRLRVISKGVIDEETMEIIVDEIGVKVSFYLA
jgi:hypothetical protein